MSKTFAQQLLGHVRRSPLEVELHSQVLEVGAEGDGIEMASDTLPGAHGSSPKGLLLVELGTKAPVHFQRDVKGQRQVLEGVGRSDNAVIKV
eukprot:1431905-Lingulodinium_polyedra.AAC.1